MWRGHWSGVGPRRERSIFGPAPISPTQPHHDIPPRYQPERFHLSLLFLPFLLMMDIIPLIRERCGRKPLQPLRHRTTGNPCLLRAETDSMTKTANGRAATGHERGLHSGAGSYGEAKASFRPSRDDRRCRPSREKAEPHMGTQTMTCIYHVPPCALDVLRSFWRTEYTGPVSICCTEYGIESVFHLGTDRRTSCCIVPPHLQIPFVPSLFGALFNQFFFFRLGGGSSMSTNFVLRRG